MVEKMLEEYQSASKEHVARLERRLRALGASIVEEL
jgi:hypothetical protein